MSEDQEKTAPAGQDDAVKETRCEADNSVGFVNCQATPEPQPIPPEAGKPPHTLTWIYRGDTKTWSGKRFNPESGQVEPYTMEVPTKPFEFEGYVPLTNWKRKTLQIFKDMEEKSWKEFDLHPFDDGAKLTAFVNGLSKEPWCDSETFKGIIEAIENTLATMGVECDVLKERAFPSVPLQWSAYDAIPIGELEAPSLDDGKTLLGNRFLCRRGSLLIAAGTGVGKSSFGMQGSHLWGIGKPFFGIAPAFPLRSLIVQAENDEGDLWEFRNGIWQGLNLSIDDREQAGRSVFVIQKNTKRGAPFFVELDGLLDKIKPDLVWIDPALAYIEGDSNSQKDVSAFLRGFLNPLLEKHECAGIVVHHTAKPQRAKDGSVLKGGGSYFAGGSAEYSNWARGILNLLPTNTNGVFELEAAKRGGRLGWKEADGTTTAYKKIIAWSKEPGVICWNECDKADLPDEQIKAVKTIDDVLAHVPPTEPMDKDALLSKCSSAGIGMNKARLLIAEAIESERLFEWLIKRDGVRPSKKLGRYRQPEQKEAGK